MERFTYNGKPYYNRFNTISDIAAKIGGEDTVDVVLETVRILEEAGIIETFEAPMADWFVVQNWEKML